MIENYYPILKNRSFQIDVVEKILTYINQGKKFILLDSPTGSGKTIIALTISDYLSKYDFITHIAVRTTEEIKRYLEDSEKIKTILKVFPNKKKTCPLFYNSNLSGEEIVCADCIYRKSLYEPEILYRRLKKLKYDFIKLAKIENKKMKENKEVKCIYQSFKKIDSKIYISTYPYVFNQYLNEILALDGEPDFLIMDESHNLLTTLINPISISFRKYLEKSFGKRKEENLLFQDSIRELEILKNALGIPEGDYKYLREELIKFSDDLLSFIENVIAKKFNTRDIMLIKERMEKTSKEIYIDKEKLKEVFNSYEKLLDNLSFYWETYKRYLSKNRLELPKKRWNINKILKLYYSLSDSNIFWIFNLFKLEGYITKFEEIIKAFDNYKSVILMSGSNFTKEDFIKLYKIKNVEYIKVDIKYGKKDYEVIYNFSSRYSLRKDERNIENLIGDIKFIANNLEKYQLFMFPSYSFMKEIYEKLDIKEKIFLDDGEKSLNKILETDKDIIFTYARSRFIEGIQLIRDNRSLLKVIVIVGKPYPPPPNASILINKLIKDNDLDYKEFAEILKDINIKQVIGRAIRFPDDQVKIFFIDDRFTKAEIKRYL
ncbi:MAG: helicase C-terminal domain-containing protein [Nanopusillaceae archaeon]|jgi:DNA excision repair protein ERCC-2